MSGWEARRTVEEAVRSELFGPHEDQTPEGATLDCSSRSVEFASKEAARGRFQEAVTGQEILTQSDPLKRYAVGVLHSGAGLRRASPSATAEESDPIPGLGTREEAPDQPVPEVSGELRHDVADADDFDLSDANSYKPSAMAVSFKCSTKSGGSLSVEVTGAYYDPVKVRIPGLRDREWWVRRPFRLGGSITEDELARNVYRLKDITMQSPETSPRVAPAVQVHTRPVPGEDDPSLHLVTVVVSNTTTRRNPDSALFQMGFTVTARGAARIEPYPETARSDRDEEEQSIDLLYREKRTYAIGHGCAADWDGVDTEARTADRIRGVALPAFEVASLTPDIYERDEHGQYVRDSDGSRIPVKVSMEALAESTGEGDRQVETVLRLYREWISEREREIADLPRRYQAAAQRHMRLCREALERMRSGWAMVASDPLAARAFQLANEAMLCQQMRSSLEKRKFTWRSNGTLSLQDPHPEPALEPGRGNWRPFQIAFLLASLPEIIDRKRPTRKLVDLIFFPTGGGKTEAYLGAAAISLLARRIREPADVGTDTLMRYTLRLLTAQQFTRAARLVCALEDLRSKNEAELGEDRFSIGIWLGSSSTPNRWSQAVAALSKMRSDHRSQNKFLLLQCPWCGAEMGPKRRKKSGQDIIGYKQVGKKVRIVCADAECRFSGREGLPVHVVDQDIYDVRPSIVIGTVDKFAMLAWRPEARSLFGIGPDGERDASPPNLIVQDELHLISGPLGSMVGLYEPVIEKLCTDERGSEPVPPKIIASTATIRRYEDQVRSLYGRDQVALFPPHGLNEGESFFTGPDTLDDGTTTPGRRYLGIFSASIGSMQSLQVRVAAATLQAGATVNDRDRDGYWTNLNFLNSLRELGNTVSLLQSDVPDYLTGLRHRDGIDPRWPKVTMELTGRRRSDDIPKAIEQLEAGVGDSGCVDICLASNIVEVGVDIDRLALLTIVGQPKTTAQYIQVSGRVGRRPYISPGLVLTLYGAAKPRDRSHYERFRTYHEQLYAQVEPTSVTPFAAPVLRRAAHSAAVACIRQSESEDTPAYPFPEESFAKAVSLLAERANAVDPGEAPALEKVLQQRAREWGSWERTDWDANPGTGDPQQGLMRYAGTLPAADSRALVWDVPTSMRNVDAECRLEVSLAYNRETDNGQEDEND